MPALNPERKETGIDAMLNLVEESAAVRVQLEQSPEGADPQAEHYN